MKAPTILLIVLLPLACIGQAWAVDWDSLIPDAGSVTGYWAGEGVITPTLNLSWQIAQYKEYRLYLDALEAEGELGAGLSTDLAPVGDLLQFDKWLYPLLPVQDLVQRCALGGAVLYEAGNKAIRPGMYLRLSVVSVKF